MPLIKLLADTEDDPIPPPPPLLKGGDFPVEALLLELHEQRQKQKQREAAFLSVIAHLCLIFLLLLNPKFFRPSPTVLQRPQDELQKEDLTYLEMPKDLITPKKPPTPPKAISDQDRHFDRQDKIQSSISAPVTRPAPVVRPSSPPPGPPAAVVAPPAPPAQPPADAANQPKPNLVRPPDNSLKLQDVPRPLLHPQLELGVSAADQLEKAMEAAARDQASHNPGLTSMSRLPQPNAGGAGGNAPGQTGAGVQILTDTQGVDFDPYLRRIVAIVQRNWEAVMPETVYLGTQGKVVIVFNINANGSVPGMRPIGLSGTASLDQAAAASISASNPFPPLPPAFHGPFITLQFSFYYNLKPDN